MLLLCWKREHNRQTRVLQECGTTNWLQCGGSDANSNKTTQSSRTLVSLRDRLEVSGHAEAITHDIVWQDAVSGG